MIELLLAQDFAIGYTITLLGILLGLAAVCIPRLRKPFDVDEGKRAKRTVRHHAAGSYQQESKYSIKQR